MMSAKYMALALAVLLPGCTMAPNYVRPEAPVAEAWPDDLMPKGTVLAQPTDQLASEIGWKTFFTDQHLQRLIQLALDNNRDLRVSALNIERARGLYQIQRADLMPGVSASGESSNKGVSADLSTTANRLFPASTRSASASPVMSSISSGVSKASRTKLWKPTSAPRRRIGAPA